MIIPDNNPNFNYLYSQNNEVDLNKCKEVKAIIEKTNYNQQDTEEFWVTSLENAEKEIKEVIDFFNATLRQGESPRKFIKLI